MHNVNFLIKPASSVCNLRCRYCFYADAAQNRTRASMGYMTRDTAELLIRRAFEATEPYGTVTFAFQGGEPTLIGLDFYQNFVAYARKNLPPKVSLHFSIQTNGILLDDSWVQFLKREQFLVGLSLDGCKDIHNLNRIDPSGLGTWNTCMASLDRLKQEKVDVNALCVVTGTCARHPKKVYTSLKKLGFSYLQFIACMDPIGEHRGQRPWSLTPQAYGRFLCQLFDLWYHDWETGNYHSIRLFDDYIHILLGDGFSTCATCGNCGGYFVAESDGSLYPCDFYTLDQWRLGDLNAAPLAQLRQGEIYTRFLLSGKTIPDDCHSCRWRNLCNGGCKFDWVYTDRKTQNYYCIAMKTLFDHAYSRMLRIVQAERRNRR